MDISQNSNRIGWAYFWRKKKVKGKFSSIHEYLGRVPQMPMQMRFFFFEQAILDVENPHFHVDLNKDASLEYIENA
jgi:hypothetical protein